MIGHNHRIGLPKVRYGAPDCDLEVPQIECRCLNPQCGKLFFVGDPGGPQKVKCPRCKTDNYFVRGG